MSLLFHLLASRRACALRKSTPCTCTLLMLGCHNQRWNRPSWRGAPFSPAPLLRSPSTRAVHASMRCCSDCACPFVRVSSPQARHAAAGLSCVDLASCEWSCAAYDYLLTSKRFTQRPPTLTNNGTKLIPAAIIAFQNDNSMYATVPDPSPLWEGSRNA